MSAVELVCEKAKTLSERQARDVLEFIGRMSRKAAPSARDLMRLPALERDLILQKQAASASELYQNKPGLLLDDVDAPLEYEQGQEG